MPIDTSIYSSLLQPVKSVADYDRQARAADMDQLQLLAAQDTRAANQRALGRQNQIQQLMAGMGGASDQKRIDALRQGAFFSEADNLEKGMLDREKTRAVVGKDNAETKGKDYDLARKKYEHTLGGLSQFQSADDAHQWLADSVKSDMIAPQQAATMLTKIPTDPAAFTDWRDRTVMSLMDAGKQAGFIRPDANAKLSAETSTANAKLSSDTQIKTTGMNNATSRANNAATIAKDFKVSGIDPQTGNFVTPGGGGGDGMAGIVDALGGYKIDPNTAFARMQPAMKANIIAQVAQKYPDYDPSTYATKVKAAKDFGSGSQGNAMRSFAVAGQHLDQLGSLVDALHNKNPQLINKIGNIYAEQTGNPAPTNFDAAKDVVSKEVVKAIVAGGGGVAERQELSHLMSNVKSPAQLKGVIEQYRGLMSAQHDALLVQRRAAGLPDKTIPNYGGGHGSASGDKSIHDQADAILRGAK